MSQTKIRAALEMVAATWSASRAGGPLALAIQNKTFKPATGQTYVRMHLLPAQSVGADLAGAYEVLTGVLQFTVVTPINVGPGLAERIAEEIKGVFPNNSRHTFDGITVQMVGPMTVHGAAEEPDAFSVPVSGRYRCDKV